MHVVEDGQAREILYSPDYFTVTEDSPARELPPGRQRLRRLLDPGEPAAGRLDASASPGPPSSARPTSAAVGELGQVGMSARGLALNVASSTPEEFPDFVAHWIAPAASESDPVVVHSLLDGPSICGAYRF